MIRAMAYKCLCKPPSIAIGGSTHPLEYSIIFLHTVRVQGVHSVDTLLDHRDKVVVLGERLAEWVVRRKQDVRKRWDALRDPAGGHKLRKASRR